MAYDASHVEDYNFTSDDELFLDANIWLFIYGLQKPTGTKMSTYSSAFRRILEAQSHIYIDVLVVSEFINVCARQRWQLVAPNTPFKVFRDSPRFKSAAQEIADNIK